jgi:hypothetical protein
MKTQQLDQPHSAANTLLALQRFYLDAKARRISVVCGNSDTRRFWIAGAGQRVVKLFDALADLDLMGIVTFFAAFVTFTAVVGVVLVLHYLLRDDDSIQTFCFGMACFVPFGIAFTIVYVSKVYEGAVDSSPLSVEEIRALYGIPLTNRIVNKILEAGHPICLRHVAEEIATNPEIQPLTADQLVAQAQRNALELKETP